MAITAGVANDAKLRWFKGEHLLANVYKIALYVAAATIGPTTTGYSATNEVTGTGYTAGGMTLTGIAITLDGTVAIIDWADVTWTGATITARGAMIYNDTVSGKPPLGIFDFGSDKTVTAGSFVIEMPAPAAATAVFQMA